MNIVRRCADFIQSARSARRNPRDSWPAWTDRPIPFALGKGVAIDDTPRGPTRRRFLGLALGTGAAGLANLGVGLALCAGESPGPIRRKMLAWESARRAEAWAYAQPLPDHTPEDDVHFPATDRNDAHEDWQKGYLDASSRAKAEFIGAVVAASGYQHRPVAWSRWDSPDALATVAEGAWLFALTFGQERWEPGQGDLIDFEPEVVAVRIGGTR